MSTCEAKGQRRHCPQLGPEVVAGSRSPQAACVKPVARSQQVGTLAALSLCNTAQPSLLRHLDSVVLLHVLGEGALAGEAHATELAGVRLVTRMAPHVHVIGRLPGVGLGAVRTNKGTLECVGADVPLLVACLPKAPVTMWALERPEVNLEHASTRNRNAWRVLGCYEASTRSW